MGGSVRGRVVRATDGRPVTGASVIIASGPGPAPDLAAVTDRRGRFALPELEEGEWVLRASGPEGGAGAATVTILTGRVAEVVIKVSDRLRGLPETGSA